MRKFMKGDLKMRRHRTDTLLFQTPCPEGLASLLALCVILGFVAAAPQAAAAVTPGRRQRLRGLREVARAIKSLSGLPSGAENVRLNTGAPNGIRSIPLGAGVPSGAKSALLKSARQVLERYGPLSPAKRRLVYRQTRRCLLTPMAQFSDGGVDGYKLWGSVFKWQFTNYVRLPDVSASQRKTASAIFRRVIRAERMLIERTYTGTPPRLRKELVARVSGVLASLVHDWPDYYSIGILYPPASAPTTKELYLALCSDGEVAADERAFTSVKALLGARHHVARKNTISLESEVLDAQTIAQVSNVRFLLMRRFSGWDQGAVRIYRNMPGSLQRRLQEFHVKMVALQRRRWREETDPAFDSGLYPTGAKILKGSGLLGH